MSISKRIRIFAGPNGSGKSTLFQEVKNYFLLDYLVLSWINKKSSTLAGETTNILELG
jgi:predicted ABC-type ATPase